MQDTTVNAIVDRLASFDAVVEIAVGHRTGIAAGLAERGVDVIATDIEDRPVPDPVSFVRDDVTEPDRSIYADAGAIYGINLPPELQRPTARMAREVDAEFFFTTLGADPTAVPVVRETIPGGTLFRAKPEPI